MLRCTTASSGTAELLERTSFTARQLLATAGISWSQVCHVLLVGGATRMPMVREMLSKLSGLEPDHRVHPDEAIAHGAAIYARWLMDSRPKTRQAPKFMVTSASSHSLGIEGVDVSTQRHCNKILIPRNTPLPARVTDRFVTRKPNQASIAIKVLEGESKAPDACTLIGRTSIRQLSPGPPAQWPIDVMHEYATNGRLSIRGRVEGTDRQVEMELEREGMLTGEQIGHWKQVVASPWDTKISMNWCASCLRSSRWEPQMWAPSPRLPTRPEILYSRWARPPKVLMYGLRLRLVWLRSLSRRGTQATPAPVHSLQAALGPWVGLRRRSPWCARQQRRCQQRRCPSRLRL